METTGCVTRRSHIWAYPNSQLGNGSGFGGGRGRERGEDATREVKSYVVMASFCGICECLGYTWKFERKSGLNFSPQTILKQE